MKKKHRSISQRLNKAKSPEARKEVLADWAKSWEKETIELIRKLEQAIKTMDYDQLCINTGQLKAVAQKRFKALPNIFVRLAEGDAKEEEGKENG